MKRQLDIGGKVSTKKEISSSQVSAREETHDDDDNDKASAMKRLTTSAKPLPNRNTQTSAMVGEIIAKTDITRHTQPQQRAPTWTDDVASGAMGSGVNVARTTRMPEHRAQQRGVEGQPKLHGYLQDDDASRKVHDAKDVVITRPMIGKRFSPRGNHHNGTRIGRTNKKPPRRCTTPIDTNVNVHALTFVEPLGATKHSITTTGHGESP